MSSNGSYLELLGSDDMRVLLLAREVKLSSVVVVSVELSVAMRRLLSLICSGARNLESKFLLEGGHSFSCLSRLSGGF